VTGQVIVADARGAIFELALARNARIEPHSNPDTTWMVVIEGGGFVEVGEETARVAAGEAVLLPAGVPHGAWTDLSEMRAIVVELAGSSDVIARGLLEGKIVEAIASVAGRSGPEEPGGAPEVAGRGDGRLATPPPAAYDPSEGEPL
jgi:hypothetical protein